MEYLAVRNWKRFQHYGDRHPPWIKLYTELLDDYDFYTLSETERGQLMSIWLLAARVENKIPNDPEWVKGRISGKSDVPLAAFKSRGFLEDWTPLADGASTGSEPTLADGASTTPASPLADGASTTLASPASNLLVTDRDRDRDRGRGSNPLRGVAPSRGNRKSRKKSGARGNGPGAVPRLPDGQPDYVAMLPTYYRSAPETTPSPEEAVGLLRYLVEHPQSRRGGADPEKPDPEYDAEKQRAIAWYQEVADAT